MRYKVVIAPRARDDLIEIYDYIAQDSLVGAQRWVGQLERAIESLSDTPERVAVRDDLRPGYRVLPVRSHLIFFRVVGQEVRIARVINAARDIARAFDDKPG